MLLPDLNVLIGAPRSDLVTEAYLAALAIETGAVLVSDDRDFARFPGLRRRRSFD